VATKTNRWMQKQKQTQWQFAKNNSRHCREREGLGQPRHLQISKYHFQRTHQSVTNQYKMTSQQKSSNGS
jgi:hypothetical protein